MELDCQFHKGCPKAQVSNHLHIHPSTKPFIHLFAHPTIHTSNHTSKHPSNIIKMASQISWTKDGEKVSERGSESGLSAIHISRNGKLVIEVKVVLFSAMFS